MKTENISLFDDTSSPLADRMRPVSLNEYVGQEHLLGPGRILRTMIKKDEIPSMILWGPAGCGKTTLARIIAHTASARFVTFSAVDSSIKDIKNVMHEAEEARRSGQRTIVFIDEIHRFNKAQQDAFLPYVEKGSIILIGATTENPSFEVNSALLSRCRVFVLHQLSADSIFLLLKRSLTDERGFGGMHVEIEDALLKEIAEAAGGDARTALNTLKMAVLSAERNDGTYHVTEDIIAQCIKGKAMHYDKKGDGHYDTISALHKSMRNSDVDAALYWLARMLEAGEDPLYIARRIVRFAAEDIGMADYRAMGIAVSAYQACMYLGMPECNVHLSEAVVFCSLAPKSNALYTAYEAAAEDARRTENEPVPMQLRNAPTKLMKQLGYGEDYQYAHDYPGHITPMICMPDSLIGKQYYHPSEEGSEKRIKERKEQIEAWKKEHRK